MAGISIRTKQHTNKYGQIVFTDHRVEIEEKIDDAINAALLEAGAEITARAMRESPVDTGQLKSSWKANLDESSHEITIGSPLENAIWNELGTGEYALNGNGCKTPWKYRDVKGNWHTTKGKPPKRTLKTAFEKVVPKITRHFKEQFGVKLK